MHKSISDAYPLRSHRGADLLHDLVLLRDLHIINERVMRELGPLPPGGLPMQAKRKPEVPKPATPMPDLPKRDVHTPHGQAPVVFERLIPPTKDAARTETATLTASPTLEPAMPYITLPNGLRVNPNPWPLKFERYSFGARCYNTLRCSIVYDNNQHAGEWDKPGGPEPEAADWRDQWSAGFIPSDSRKFLEPISIEWYSLDGSHHRELLDLELIFKDRIIHHDVPRNEIPEGWAHKLSVDVLLEVNHRTVSVYMKARIAMKEQQTPGNPHSCGRTCLTLVWTRMY